MKYTRGEKIIILIFAVIVEILLGAAIVWLITHPLMIEIAAENEAGFYSASRKAEPEDSTEDSTEETIVVYREGDGEPPEWYKPDEEMAAEWSSSYGQVGKPNKEAVFDDSFPESAPDQQVKPLDVPLDAKFQEYLYGLCLKYEIPYTLAVAVIEAESTYRADVISKSSDYGLMQINKVCIKELRFELFGDKSEKDLRIGAILDSAPGWRKAKTKRRNSAYAKWSMPMWVRIDSPEDNEEDDDGKAKAD